MYTIQISKHIKISFYNFCSNQFLLLVCHSANCCLSTEWSQHTSRQSIFSVLNTFFFSFVGCIHCAFSSSPSVQSCEFTIRIIQVYRAGSRVRLFCWIVKIMSEQECSSVGYVAACMYGRVHENMSGPKVVFHPGGNSFVSIGSQEWPNTTSPPLFRIQDSDAVQIIWEWLMPRGQFCQWEISLLWVSSCVFPSPFKKSTRIPGFTLTT